MRGRTGRVAGRALRAPGQLSGRRLACAGGAVCCRKEAGPWPDWPCRLLASRKAGKVPAKPAARTCTILSIKRGPQPPLQGANRSAGAPAAKRQRRHSAADALLPFDEARASARRSKARRDSGGTPPRIAQREHPPRTCVSVLHKRERQLAAPRRESLRPSTDYSTLMMK